MFGQFFLEILGSGEFRVMRIICFFWYEYREIGITDEKSQKDQVVTASKPSKPLLTYYIIAMSPLQR